MPKPAERTRSSYLTAAITPNGDSTDDFTDLAIDASSVDRVGAALRTGFTRAAFNGVVAAGFHGEFDDLLPLLIKTYRNCGNADSWNVVEAGEADLPTTLGLIRMEVVESIGMAGRSSAEVLSFLTELLRSDDDALHFAAFTTLCFLGSEAALLAPEVEQYLAGLDERAVTAASVPFLRDSATKALQAIRFS